MILLDTNIISELMGSKPNKAVVEWLKQEDSAMLYLSSVTLAEVKYGLEILPVGKRRKFLESRFEQFISLAFPGRVLSFDENAAAYYGSLMAGRRSMGRPMNTLDGQIAAIALSNNAKLATRNVKDFAHCDLELLNPFVM